jgi:cytochrome c553
VKFVRWALIAGGAILALALGFVGWVYAASEAHLRSFERPLAFEHPISEDSAAVARGEHLARTRGCGGCHGADLAGDVMWGSAVAPNLTALARSETPATLEAALRHAIGHDGRALYSMPSYNFVHLRDQDVADIIAYLRAAPVVERQLPKARLPFMTRFEIARGNDAAIPAFLDRVPPLRRQEDANESVARGEYLAMTSCNECHGFSLRADTPWGDAAPDLIVIGSYSAEDFTRLMRTGIAPGERELPMMTPVARGRFVHWTDEEVTDLYAFLSDMSARAIAEEAR